jgi:radical SAM protein with 4Fe4S-binding SPASM domain
MKREKKIMPQKDFEKIVNNCLKDYSSIHTIIITGFGEPFIDKEITKKIDFINKKFPKIKIDIYTNGSLLNEEVTKELLSKKIHKINFSINGTERTYKKMMSLNYKNTIKNVVCFLEEKKKSGKIFPLINISMMIVKENEKEIKDFENFWINKADSVMIYLPSDWAGKKNINYAVSNPFKTKKWACFVLWNNITVDVEGNLIMCCRDYESKIKFGNLLKQDAKKIFEGKTINKIREMQLKDNFSMPLCKECDNSFDSSMDWWN